MLDHLDLFGQDEQSRHVRGQFGQDFAERSLEFSEISLEDPHDLVARTPEEGVAAFRNVFVADALEDDIQGLSSQQSLRADFHSQSMALRSPDEGIHIG